MAYFDEINCNLVDRYDCVLCPRGPRNEFTLSEVEGHIEEVHLDGKRKKRPCNMGLEAALRLFNRVLRYECNSFTCSFVGTEDKAIKHYEKVHVRSFGEKQSNVTKKKCKRTVKKVSPKGMMDLLTGKSALFSLLFAVVN